MMVWMKNIIYLCPVIYKIFFFAPLFARSMKASSGSRKCNSVPDGKRNGWGKYELESFDDEGVATLSRKSTFINEIFIAGLVR